MYEDIIKVLCCTLHWKATIRLNRELWHMISYPPPLSWIHKQLGIWYVPWQSMAWNKSNTITLSQPLRSMSAALSILWDSVFCNLSLKATTRCQSHTKVTLTHDSHWHEWEPGNITVCHLPFCSFHRPNAERLSTYTEQPFLYICKAKLCFNLASVLMLF